MSSFKFPFNSHVLSLNNKDRDLTVIGQQLCLVPFLYAGGAQWSVHRKHGIFCWIHNPRWPWFLASALLPLIYVRFNKTSSFISWKDKYRREFSCMSLFLKLLLHAWKKQIKYVDQWAFFVGGLFCLNSQGSEHRDCLLPLSSQWTKPQSVY